MEAHAALPPEDRLPTEDEVVDRLHRHLRRWLGAWPPTGPVTVATSAARTEPGWDGAVRPFAGIATPEGAVLSVPPECVDDARRAGATLEEVLDALPQALGRPGAVVGR